MLPLLLVDHGGPIGVPLLTMEISNLSTQLLDPTLELQNAWHEDIILPPKLISGVVWAQILFHKCFGSSLTNKWDGVGRLKPEFKTPLCLTRV